MSKRNVEVILGKAMLDRDFGAMLQKDFDGTIEKTGLSLTDEEKENILKMGKRLPLDMIHPQSAHERAQKRAGCYTIDEGCGTLDWDPCDDCAWFDCPPPTPHGVGDDGDGLIA